MLDGKGTAKRKKTAKKRRNGVAAMRWADRMRRADPARMSCCFSFALLILPLLASGPGPAQAQGGDGGFSPVTVPANPIRDPRRDVVYFVMPDRFANGDPTNDRGGIAGTRTDHGFDPTHKGFFHGGDLKGLEERLDYIAGLGANAVWVTPIFKNKPVQGPKGAESAAYHGYWITDFTQVDPHLGTNADFARLVRAAHARGMKVFMDIVVNHTADVIQYRECATSGDIMSGVPAAGCPYRAIADYPWTTVGGPDGPPINEGFLGDDPVHQTPENFAHLTDPRWAYTPFVPKSERRVKVPGWLNDPIYYHNRGNSTFEGESSTYGDFFGLDDLFTEHPRVRAGMIAIFRDWIRRFRVDGFRIDTARHVDDGFWRVFLPAMLAEAKKSGIPDFAIFGEVAHHDPRYLARFVRAVGFPAVLDFPFAYAARAAIAGTGSLRRLADVFAADDLYTAPGRGADQLFTFIGNHDMGRFGHAIRAALGDDADPREMLARATLGHALLFFARGTPVVYYGAEQGFTGDGGDQLARQDMFASQVAVYNDDPVIGGAVGATARDNFDVTHPLYRRIRAMARLRRSASALESGIQITRFADDGPGLFVFSRIDPQAGREFVVALNTARERRTAEFTTAAAGPWALRQATADLGGRVRAEAAGDPAHPRLHLSLPPLSYAVLTAEIAKPSKLPPPHVSLHLPKPGAAGYARVEITGPAGAAAARGQIPITIRFVATSADGRRCPLGEDRAAPWRIWWDPAEELCAQAVALTAEALLPDGRVQTVTAPLAPPAAAP